MEKQKKSSVLLMLIVLTFVSMSARLWYHNPSLHFDECYHALVARSILTDGDLSMFDSAAPYTRGAVFSYMVAGSIKLFGDSVWATRLPAMICGSLIVLVLAEWMRRQTNLLAGWIVGLLIAFSLHAINTSSFARFYTVHALLVLVALLMLYIATLPRLSLFQRELSILIAAACGLASLKFQIIGLVPISLASGWVAACMLMYWTRTKPLSTRISLLAAMFVLGAGAAYLLLIPEQGLFNPLWQSYRYPAIWSESISDDVRFYSRHYANWYGWAWFAFPLGILISVIRWPRITFFCALVYMGTMVAMSFGGMKSHRYTFHIQPLFWCIWAMAAAAILQWLFIGITCWRPQWKPSMRVAVTTAIAIVITAPLGWKTREFKDAAMILVQGDKYPYPPFAQSKWYEASPLLNKLASKREAIITSVNAKAVYYLGEPGYTMSATLTEDRPEFSHDWRFAAPVFKTLDSLKQVMADHKTGLVVVEKVQWRTDWSVSNQVCDHIEQTMTRVTTPEDWKLRVYLWDNMSAETSRPF